MKSSMRSCGVLSLLLALGAAPAAAAVPQTLSLQGLLTNSAGQPLTGSHNLVFRIYSVPTGGTALFTETHADVPVVDGAFSVILGKTTLLNLPFDAPYHIGTSVDADPELSPRLELSAVAYSLNARTVQDNAITSAKIADNTITSADIGDGQLKAADLAAGQVVRTFNNLKDHVVLVGGPNVAVTTDPTINQIAISFSGASSAGGDVTAVIAGAGLSGGGTSGALTLGLATGGVTGQHLADGTVNTIDIAPNAITTTKIIDGTLTGADLANNTITSAKIAGNAVTSAHLADGTVATADLADNAVTSAKIAAGTISSANIGANQVVRSLNAIRETVSLVGGNGITVTPKPATREIAISFSGAFSTTGGGTAGGGGITSVTAGPGLSGGGTSGPVTLALASEGITARNIAPNQVVKSLNGLRENPTLRAGPKVAISANSATGIITIGLTDTSTSSSGAISAVTAGSGLTGGGTSGAVTLALANGGVTGQYLADDAVTSAKIANNAITASDIADGTVTSFDIADGTISTNDILGRTITSDNIANGQILRSLNNLRDHATLVAGPKLALTTNTNTNQITVGLADTNASGDITAVTAGTGLTGGGTSGAVSLALATGGVTSQHLADNTVTGAKVLDGSLSGVDIFDGTLTHSDIADGMVTSADIAINTITGEDIANNAITSAKIALNTITGEDIAFRTIEGQHIRDGTIGSWEIGTNALTSENIRAGQVVKSLNGLRDTLALVAGPKVSLTVNPAANQIAVGLADSISGDLTALSAGSGLSGGGTSGALTLGIANGGVTSQHLADGTLTSADLADNGVALTDLADASVNSAKVVDNTLTSADVLDGTLTAADLAPGQVAKSLNGLRDNLTLVGGDNVAIASDPATNQITIGFTGSGAGASGGSGQITALNAGSGLSGGGTTGALTLGLASGGVTSQHLADLNVTTPKIAADAVTSDKIPANAVTSEELAANAVQTAEIADGAVTSAKVANSAINAAQVIDNTLTSADLLDGSLTAADIASGQVVKSLNNLRDSVTLEGDEHISVTSDAGGNRISVVFSDAPSNTPWVLGGNGGIPHETLAEPYLGTLDATPLLLGVGRKVLLRFTASGSVLAGEYAGGNSQAVTIGGGRGNNGGADYATVSGGRNNNAVGEGATVCGGGGNNAHGLYAAIGGGFGNYVFGDYGFAAGSHAVVSAAHDGTFLFADQNSSDFASAAANEFAARATGGVRFVTAVNTSTGAPTGGVQLPAGGSAWQTLSDRNAKQHFRPVDSRRLLEKLAALPIQTWNYKTQADSIRHLGPMAQDFRAAFGLGEDETHISTVDADGVALAAIQGLYQVVQEQQTRIEALQQQVDAQARQLAALQAHQSLLQDLQDRLAALERAPAAGLRASSESR